MTVSDEAGTGQVEHLGHWVQPGDGVQPSAEEAQRNLNRGHERGHETRP